MRAKVKQLLGFLLAICIIMASVALPQNVMVVEAATADQAIAWVQSQVGKAIDYDGVYGAQCVDLIKAYYNYLGVAPVSGNGCDYATNSLPSGWQRIAGGTPQKGDILVYSGNSSNPYGHVAIFESNNVTYHQNFAGNQYVQRVTISYNGFSNPYWGVIRPNFSGSSSGVSVSWSNSDCQWDTINAYMYIEADTNVSGSFTQAGITVWNEAGGVIGTKSEDPGITGTHLNVWYNLTNELGIVLQPGTNYKYQFHIVFNGTRYTSSVMSFRTNGQAQNSWTKELSIDNWVYGETAKTPSAAAKYGTVQYTYSTERNGTYTTEAPKNAGTYYVKASVAAVADQYTGLEAVKEFKIEKAIPQYTIPTGLTITYGERLGSIALPEGFEWYDETELSGPVGNRVVAVRYVPEDENNYTSVENISVVITVVEKGLPFVDVNSQDWFGDYVKYVYENQIMTGLEDTIFGPNDPLARAQFALILYRMNDEPDVAYKTTFPDVPDNIWFTDAVLWAADTGVVTGYTATGMFGPSDLINREQIATMMYRYANYKDYESDAPAYISSYKDADKVSAYAREAMMWAVGNKIISGKENGTVLDPQGSATRAECAAIIMRFQEKFEK